MTPKPPPGFEIIEDGANATPPPPPGFVVIQQQPQQQAEMRSYEPTWREKIGGYISDMFGNSAEGDRLASGVVGSSGLGHTRTSVSDFTPARIPMYAQEAKRNYDAGNTGHAVLDAIGAAPVPVLNKAIETAGTLAAPVVEQTGQIGTQIAARLPQRVTGKSADDVANRVLSDRLQRSGQSADSVAADLEAGQRSARLDSNSNATLPEALADTSDDMQRLTGSVYRTGGEAGEIVKPALELRQRGPANPYAPRTTTEPQGQIERIVDDFDRALTVKSSKGARATSQELEAAQKARADELYTKAKTNSETFDLDPVNTAWRMKAMNYQGEFKSKLENAIDLFSRPAGSFKRWDVDNIERFDNAKKVLDDLIERSKEMGKATNLTRELTGYKRDLLAKVEEGGKNKYYTQARNEFGSAAENREAIDLGRKSLREDSEVSVDLYRSLTPAQQKFFRIGMRDALRLALATKKPGDNATLLLQQRRVRELLSEVIPTPRGKTAEFADRAERFGDLMRREERMSQTKNAVLGNSATAQRVNDDAQFASDAVSKILASGRNVTNLALETVAGGLQKVFGYRQDVAASLARKLVETDPAARAEILNVIRQQHGPKAFSEFSEGIRRPIGQRAITGAPAALSPKQEQDNSISGAQGLDYIGGGPEQDTLQRTPEEIAAWEKETGRKYWPGVPSGQGNEIGPDSIEADQQRQAAEQDAASRSFVRAGEKIIVPNNIADLKDMAGRGLSAAGEVLSAFPQGGPIDEAISAVGNAVKGYKAAQPLTAAEKAAVETKQAGEAAKRRELDAFLKDERAKMAKMRDEIRAEKDRAAYSQKMAEEAKAKRMTGTVPDTATAKAERQTLLDGLPEGTAPMPIKGRQGFPTREEQIDLVNKYIDKGGRLDPGGVGPWGGRLSKSEDARDAINKQWAAENPPAKATSQVPEANMPSVGDLADAYRTAKAEADSLRARLAALEADKSKMISKESVESMRLLLKETQHDVIRLQKLVRDSGKGQ